MALGGFTRTAPLPRPSAAGERRKRDDERRGEFASTPGGPQLHPAMVP